MDGVLKSRQHVLNGIANGIDEIEWDPASDKLIPKNYDRSNLSGVTAKPASMYNELAFMMSLSLPRLPFNCILFGNSFV